MDDERYAIIEARREQARYFTGLEKAAQKAARRGTLVIRTKVSKPAGAKLVPRQDRQSSQRALDELDRIVAGRKGPKKPYQRKPRGQWRPKSGRPKTSPDNCVRCERPFRPRRAKIADYPGTVYHVGHGLCRTCEQAPRTETNDG